MTPEEEERARIQQEIRESLEGDTDQALDKIAAGRVGRWLARQKTKLMGGRTKGLKLEADRQVRATSKAMDRLMDSLEKSNVPGNELIDRLQGVARHLSAMLPAIAQVAMEHDRVIKERKAVGEKGVKVDVRDYRLLNDAIKQANEFVTRIDSYRKAAAELAEAERKLRA
jgi:hypothetical protein